MKPLHLSLPPPRTVVSIGMALVVFCGGGAAAQSVVPAAPNPSVGGQASTMSPAGVPNPTQRPEGNGLVSRDAVRAEAWANNRSWDNTQTPLGQVSTMTHGQPNATPTTGLLSRAQVRPSAGDIKARPEIPTNPVGGMGTPK